MRDRRLDCTHDQVLMVSRWKWTAHLIQPSVLICMNVWIMRRAERLSIEPCIYGAQCIRKCNSWMIEKPIKVVIKLQMSSLSVFLPLSMGSRRRRTRCATVREPLASTRVAPRHRTHFPIQFLPAALVKHSARSIFFNYARRGRAFL